MSLVRWLPRRNGLQSVSLDTELGRLFEDFFTPVPVRSDGGALSPAVDVEETSDAYVFRADLPGVSSKDVKVTVHNDTITLRGERKREEKKSDGSRPALAPQPVPSETSQPPWVGHHGSPRPGTL